MTNTSAIRIIRDSCCVRRGLSLVLENIFHNAIVKAILDEQWLTVVNPHAEETNASGCMTINRVDDSACELCQICWEQGPLP